MSLTPYDTGARLEPISHDVDEVVVKLLGLSPEEVDDRYGRVDLDDNAGCTIVTLYAERNEHGGYTLHVEGFDPDVLTIEAKGE